MARYVLVPERSHVRIEARSGLHPLKIAADGLEGWVDLAVEGRHVDLAVPPDGRLHLPVDRLTTGNRLEDHELRRRIDARAFPAITGELTGIEALEDCGPPYEISGNLTFHGVTRSYKDEMAVEAVDDGMTLRLAGRSRFDMRDFGVAPPRMLFVRFEPQVDVEVEIHAERAEDGGALDA